MLKNRQIEKCENRLFREQFMVADKWMGCKESKSQNDIDGTDGDRNQAETVDFVENMDRNVDYKSRFEWKMCRVSQTTP